MNITDFIIICILILMVFLAVRSIIRNRGEKGCGGGCSSCLISGSCHYKNKTVEIKNKKRGK